MLLEVLAVIDYKRCLQYIVNVESKVLDYNSIISECGIGVLPQSAVMKNISLLENKYDEGELVCIYNYLLLNIQDDELLSQIIKCTDSHRAKSTLAILSEMLQNIPEDDENTDSSVNLRSLCAKAIANYKDTSVVTILLDCLNNKKENYKVRLACADALGRIGDRFAVRPLINLVEDEDEKSVYLKESAAFALGLIGDTSAIDPLVSLLNSKHAFMDKFTFLKEKIVEALGRLNSHNKNIMDALKNSLMDPSPIVRINAIEAIMNSDDEDAYNIIKPCLSDEDDEVKKNTLIALYNLTGRDILDEVIELPIYSNYLKQEAKELIDEYEEDDE